MSSDDLAGLEGWTGDASELARVAGEILSARGLMEGSTEPTVRVIRDYAQRGIVSRAERQGKEAIYGFRQLLEFVAARVLVADGWPLAKIAEHFAHIGEAELRSLASGNPVVNRALEVIRRLRSETASAPAGPSTKPSRYKTSPRPADEFRERAAQLSSLQAQLQDALRRLGLPEDYPAVEQLTLIAVAPWCQVLIESSRLPRLTIEEAQEIGRAVTASLLTVAKKPRKE